MESIRLIIFATLRTNGEAFAKNILLVFGLEITTNDYMNTKGDPIFSRIEFHNEIEYVGGNEDKRNMGSLQRSYQRTELGKLPPDYIAGFIDGEGSFSIIIAKHKQKKLGLDARLNFGIELRDDDSEILLKIQETLGCGRIYHLSYQKYGWYPHSLLKVSSYPEIRDKLIPFLQKYPLRAKKRLAFELFVQAADVFEHKEHLTKAGIEQLYEIRKLMNKYSKKGGIPSVRQGAGKPRARRGENSVEQLTDISQNTAHQASKVGGA